MPDHSYVVKEVDLTELNENLQVHGKNRGLSPFDVFCVVRTWVEQFAEAYGIQNIREVKPRKGPTSKDN